MKPTAFAMGLGIGLFIAAALAEPRGSAAQEPPASAGVLINLWNDAAWKRFRNPAAEIGKADQYVPAALEGRRMTVPGIRKTDTHAIYFINEYTFDKDLDGAVYLTHVSAFYREPHMEVAVFFNDRELKRFTPLDLPLNVKLADTVKAGDTATVAVRSTSDKNVSNVLSFAMERYTGGATPGKALETLHPAAGQASPKLTYAGTIEPGYKARHESQQAQLQKQKPRVIFVGDSITDGFDDAGAQHWATLQGFNPANLGISGDWTHNLHWRLENSVIDQVRPELIVLMIGTNNGAYTEDEVVISIKAILDCIRAKSPTTRILLHGILPRDADYAPGNRYGRINDRIATFADGKSVHYMDLSEHFLTPDHKTRTDLLPDHLHPNAAGYEAWTKAITPKLAELLPPTP